MKFTESPVGNNTKICLTIKATKVTAASAIINQYFLKNLMHQIREAIKEDRLLDFKNEFFKKFGYKL